MKQTEISMKSYHLYYLQIHGCGNHASLGTGQKLLLLLLLQNRDSRKGKTFQIEYPIYFRDEHL